MADNPYKVNVPDVAGQFKERIKEQYKSQQQTKDIAAKTESYAVQVAPNSALERLKARQQARQQGTQIEDTPVEVVTDKVDDAATFVPVAKEAGKGTIRNIFTAISGYLKAFDLTDKEREDLTKIGVTGFEEKPDPIIGQQMAEIVAASNFLKANEKVMKDMGFVDQLVYATPNVAISAALSIATRKPKIGASFMGLQIMGNQIEQLTEKGVAPVPAANAGLWNAILQYPMEQFGLGKTTALWRSKAAILKRLQDMAIATGTEFTTEAGQVLPEKITDVLAQNPSKGTLDAIWNSLNMETLKQMGLEGSMGAIFGFGISGAGAIKSMTLKEAAETITDDDLKKNPSETRPEGTTEADAPASDTPLTPEDRQNVIEKYFITEADTDPYSIQRQAEEAATLPVDRDVPVLGVSDVMAREGISRVAPTRGGEIPIASEVMAEDILAEPEGLKETETYDQIAIRSKKGTIKTVDFRKGGHIEAIDQLPLDEQADTEDGMITSEGRFVPRPTDKDGNDIDGADLIGEVVQEPAQKAKEPEALPATEEEAVEQIEVPAKPAPTTAKLPKHMNTPFDKLTNPQLKALTKSLPKHQADPEAKKRLGEVVKEMQKRQDEKTEKARKKTEDISLTPKQEARFIKKDKKGKSIYDKLVAKIEAAIARNFKGVSDIEADEMLSAVILKGTHWFKKGKKMGDWSPKKELTKALKDFRAREQGLTRTEIEDDPSKLIQTVPLDKVTEGGTVDFSTMDEIEKENFIYDEIDRIAQVPKADRSAKDSLFLLAHTDKLVATNKNTTEFLKRKRDRDFATEKEQAELTRQDFAASATQSEQQDIFTSLQKKETPAGMRDVLPVMEEEKRGVMTEAIEKGLAADQEQDRRPGEVARGTERVPIVLRREADVKAERKAKAKKKAADVEARKLERAPATTEGKAQKQDFGEYRITYRKKKPIGKKRMIISKKTAKEGRQESMRSAEARASLARKRSKARESVNKLKKVRTKVPMTYGDFFDVKEATTDTALRAGAKNPTRAKVLGTLRDKWEKIFKAAKEEYKIRKDNELPIPKELDELMQKMRKQPSLFRMAAKGASGDVGDLKPAKAIPLTKMRAKALKPEKKKAKKAEKVKKAEPKLPKGIRFDSWGEEGTTVPPNMVQVTVVRKGPGNKATFAIDPKKDVEKQVAEKLKPFVKAAKDMKKAGASDEAIAQVEKSLTGETVDTTADTDTKTAAKTAKNIVENERGEIKLDLTKTKDWLKDKIQSVRDGARAAQNLLAVGSKLKDLGGIKTANALRQYYSKISAYEIEGKNEAKKMLREYAKENDNFDKGVMADVTLSLDDKRYFDSLSADRRIEIEGAVKKMETFFENRRTILNQRMGKEIGFVQNKLAELERLSKEARTPEERQKVINRAEMWEDLRHVRFTHIPLQLALEKLDIDMHKKNLSKRDYRAKRKKFRAFSQALKKRRVVSINKMLQNKKNPFTKSHFDPVSVMMSYQAKFAKDMATLDIRDALVADGLLTSMVNKKGKKIKKPKGMIEMGKGFGLLSDYYVHPTARQAIENMMQVKDPSTWYDKMIGHIKMAAFYNPIFLPAYDLYQSAMIGGSLFHNPLKAPLNIGKAAYHTLMQDSQYRLAMHDGLFSKPFNMTWADWKAEMDMLRKGKGKGGVSGWLGHLGRTALHDTFSKSNIKSLGLKPIYHASWHIAWRMDEAIRMFTYLQLKDSMIVGKMSSQDAAKVAARFHGDYANVPPNTRKWMNRVLFTPTFKIAMGTMYSNMVTGSIRTMLGSKSQKDAAYTVGLATLTASTVVFDQIMRNLGFEPEDDKWYNFGRRYVSKTKGKYGEPRELVFTWSNPGNIGPRYIQRIAQNTEAWKDGRQTITKSLFNVLKYDLHPLFQAMAGGLENRTATGNNIYNEGDDDMERALREAAYYLNSTIKMTEQMQTILERVGTPGDKNLFHPEIEGQSRREAKVWAKKQGKVMEILTQSMLSIFSVYTRNPKQRKIGSSMKKKIRNHGWKQKQYFMEHGKLNKEWTENLLKEIKEKEKEYRRSN